MTDEKPRPSLIDAIRTKTVRTEVGDSLPRGLRVTTAYAWRFVVIAVAAGILIWLIIQLKLLVVPLLISILVTALLWPAFTWMLRRGVPRWLALVISVLGTIAIVAGLVWLAVWQIVREWPRVQERTVAAVEEFRQYLIDGPLHLTADQIDDRVGVPNLVVEAARPEVDHRVRPELAHKGEIIGPCGRDGAHAGVAGQLNRIGADVSRRAMDDHGLSGLDPSVIEQGLPCRHGNHGNRCRFDRGQRGGLARDHRGGRQGKLGIGPDELRIGHAVDSVSHTQAGHFRSQGDDFTR